MKKVAQTMKAIGSSDVAFGPMFAPLFSGSKWNWAESGRQLPEFSHTVVNRKKDRNI